MTHLAIRAGRLDLLTVAGLIGLTACSSSQPNLQPDPANLTPVSIPFAALVGERSFACGQTYDNLGATGSQITPTDLRFFVSEVELIDRRGRAVRLQPTTGDVWSHEGVTLLDFEDGTGPCTNGSAETNTAVRGLAPAGDYNGVRFTLGVPFDQNHLDHNRQPSPLNVTSMFWAWRSGYKFLRMDFRTSGPARQLFLHIGSTECLGADTTARSATRSCGAPNRARIELPTYRVGQDTVALDLSRLLAGANLDENHPETARGCMSAASDPDCAPIFANLGLPFGATQATRQSTFHVLDRRLAQAP
ncbi:MAG: metallo-mystery pair system four-Cys motif protein [Gemmatimonadales bacterium]|nr:metallo-mystery pair system four-Cys motif protein [Gemmatimonadales bacterium]